MCKYQIVDANNNLPICEGTKQLCTMCVLGNMSTFDKLESENNKNKDSFTLTKQNNLTTIISY